MVLRRFDFQFDQSKKTEVDWMDTVYKLEHPVGMRTGATIHTRKGLHMDISRRKLD